MKLGIHDPSRFLFPLNSPKVRKGQQGLLEYAPSVYRADTIFHALSLQFLNQELANQDLGGARWLLNSLSIKDMVTGGEALEEYE